MPYPTPDAAEACALLEGLCLVYKGDALAEVEVSLLLAVHAIDLNQGSVVVLICFPPAMCGSVGKTIEMNVHENASPPKKQPQHTS